MENLKHICAGVSLPLWLAALLVLMLGWLAAILIRLAVSRALELPIFTRLWKTSGFSEFLRKGQVSYSPARLVGAIAYWVILLVVLFLCSSLMNVSVAETLSMRLVSAAPGLVAALFTVIIGAIMVTFVGNFVMTVARNAALPHSRLLSQTIKGLGMLLVLAMAVEQVNVGTTMITSIFLMFFGAVVFGLALAFGLGCKDMARDAMEKLLKNLRERDRTSKDPDLEG